MQIHKHTQRDMSPTYRVSIMSIIFTKKTIAMTSFANDFVQGEHAELFRVVLLYCCGLIGHILKVLAITFFTLHHFFPQS